MKLSELKKKLQWLDPFTYVDRFIIPHVNPGNNETLNWVIYIASAFIFAWLIYNGVGLLLGTPSPMVIVVSGSMQPAYHRGDVIVVQGTAAQGINAPGVELMEYASLGGIPLSDYAETLCSGNIFPNLVDCVQYKIQLGQGQISEKDFVVKEIVFDDKHVPVTKQGSIVVYFSQLLKKPIIHRVVAKLRAQDGWYVLTKGDSPQNPILDQGGGIAASAVAVKDLDGKAILWVPFIGCVKLWLVDDLGSLIARGALPPDFAGVC